MTESKAARGRSVAEVQQVVADFEASGLGRKAFCASRSLSVNTLDNWRKRSRSGEQARAAKAPATPFVELAPLRGVGALEVELELGGGVVLRLRRSG